MDFIAQINNAVSGVVWGAPMLALMLFTGGYFSLRTGFFQLRHFAHCLKATVLSGGRDSADGKRNDPAAPHKITQRQAMCSALAATLGTGNIAGVSAALAIGGAGAVFWMWVSAVFGMMTGFAENVLGIFYRRLSRKGAAHYQGGAMRYIRDGLSESPLTRPFAKPLAAMFAVLCVCTAFGMGNMAQTNSAAEALKVGFGINPAVTGAVLAALAAPIIFGGAKRTAAVAEKLVPLMSAFYIIGSAYILITNWRRLPEMLAGIVGDAFGLGAVGGGICGSAVRKAVSTGFRRGVFSNEAGLGTSVAAHTRSDVREPVVQGMWSIFEVFFDTIVMCSLTAFVLLCSGSSAPTMPECLCAVTTRTQYFRLTEDDGLITDGEIVIEDGTVLHCRTAYGGEFEITAEGLGTTYSNIMSITGIQSTDPQGELLWLDESKERPLIETARLEAVNGAGLAAYAFSLSFGNAAGKLLAIAVTCFAFSTLIGWSVFGTQAIEYILGDSKIGNAAGIAFKLLFTAFAAVGACADMSVAWGISDTLNGLMAVPNLIAVLALSGKVLKITRNYTDRIFRSKSIPPLLSAEDDSG